MGHKILPLFLICIICLHFALGITGSLKCNVDTTQSGPGTQSFDSPLSDACDLDETTGTNAALDSTNTDSTTLHIHFDTNTLPSSAIINSASLRILVITPITTQIDMLYTLTGSVSGDLFGGQQTHSVTPILPDYFNRVLTTIPTINDVLGGITLDLHFSYGGGGSFTHQIRILNVELLLDYSLLDSKGDKGDKGDKGEKGDRGLSVVGSQGQPGYVYHVYNDRRGDRDGEDADRERYREKRSVERFARDEKKIDQEAKEVEMLKQQVQKDEQDKKAQQKEIDELQEELKTLLKKIKL